MSLSQQEVLTKNRFTNDEAQTVRESGVQGRSAL